ncbi:MAG: hypothetical protein Q9223_005071 [Gallowayella weberi]
MFGFIDEARDIGGYMEAIHSMLPAFTIGGTLPSYLTQLFLLSTIIVSPSVRGALGAVKRIEHTSKTAKHDILSKMLETNANRGEELNFTYQDIYLESHVTI